MNFTFNLLICFPHGAIIKHENDLSSLKIRFIFYLPGYQALSAVIKLIQGEKNDSVYTF